MMYSKDIDHYLSNRPHQMIRHCLAKKNEAENMDTTGIKNLGNGMFFIKHYNNAAWKTYQVNFGDDGSMPSCTCYCRRTSAYPCKNVFSIFKKFPAWGWDSLSSLYCNLPYLNLDELDENPVENVQDNTVNLLELPVDGEGDKAEEIILQDIPKRKNKMLKQQHGEHFRSILNNIRSMSCLIEDDENVMKEASKKLKSLKNSIEESLPKESGIPLLKSKETLYPQERLH